MGRDHGSTGGEGAVNRTLTDDAVIGVTIALYAIAAAIVIVVATGCSLDYRDPVVGGQAAATLEHCRANRTEPCGWVYAFAAPADNELGRVELCVLWPDRIAPYPAKLLESAESLYGDAELSWHERFAGAPICRYACPSMMGCNAYGGYFCLGGS
jgi:hypothetical protein